MKPRVVVAFSIFYNVIVSKMIYVGLFLHASWEILDQFWISWRIKGENRDEKLWTKLEELTGNLRPVILRSPRFCLPLLQYG